MRKAQITVFIIVGLVVLFSVLLFTFFRNSIIERQPDVIVGETDPISLFVGSCIKSSAQDAVELLGQQGGFIDIPLNIDVNPSRYVNPDGLGIVKIPFWYQRGIKSAPTIGSVQDDISVYVEENVRNCINNFQVFEQQFTVDELGGLSVTTFLNKDDVSLTMDYPIRVAYRTNSTVTSFDRFTTKIPVRLRKVLETASDILDAELEKTFLENFTINLMATNGEVPFTGMEFTCGVQRWPINDVKETVADMLRNNLPRTRVKNTNYLPFNEPEDVYEKLLEFTIDDIAEGNGPENVPDDAYEYLHMFFDLGLEQDDSIAVGFSLPAVGIDLIGRPHENGVLRSNMVEGDNQFMRFFCVNLYHFVYDVNYPVVVSIRDEQSFGGSGYRFNYAFPVTIHNNAPFKENYGYDLFTTTFLDTGFCEDRGSEVVDIRALGKEAGISALELSEVNISLECFRYHCPLGQTDADGGIYRLRTTLPGTCENPFIVAEKEGYLSTKKQITDDRLDIELTKLKDFEYEVVYHRYNSVGDVLGPAQPLESDMEVSIQLITGDYYQHKLFPLEDNLDEDIRTTNLVDGNAEYDVDIILTQGGNFVGGFRGKWSPNSVDVATSNKVVFHTLKYVPTPQTKEDTLQMMQYLLEGEYSLNPTFE